MKRIANKLMIYGIVIFLAGVALQVFSMLFLQLLFDRVEPGDMFTANALGTLSTIFSTSVIPLGMTFIAASVVVRMLENHLRLDEPRTPSEASTAAGAKEAEILGVAPIPEGDDDSVETFTDDFYRR